MRWIRVRPLVADSRGSQWSPIAAVGKPSPCREGWLTGAVANSHYRLGAVVRENSCVALRLIDEQVCSASDLALACIGCPAVDQRALIALQNAGSNKAHTRLRVNE